ncbi:hypothetical protein [Nocardiopsis sp. NPDC006938]|uniref:hypothetical protein n=1 Tax=Nocardiopsis sp. NPDC006938 TaxID=3364337 RepID=UPI0036A761B1
MTGPSTALPRPSARQVLGARVLLRSQSAPTAVAVGGGLAAGAVLGLMALASAAPALTDPTGTPGWVLLTVAAVMLAAAALCALWLRHEVRSLPRVTETDPARYAAARLRAASGALGPDPEENGLARQLTDRLERRSDPRVHMVPVFTILAFVTVRALVEVVGPGFEPLMLLQLVPALLILLLVIPVYRHGRALHTRYATFRRAYDAARA